MIKLIKSASKFLIVSCTLILLLTSYLIIFESREEIKFSCRGSIFDRSANFRSIGESSFIFEIRSKYMFWAPSGIVHFELTEPERFDAFKIYYAYRITDHIFRLAPISERYGYAGMWSMISDRLNIEIAENISFEGRCTAQR